MGRPGKIFVYYISIILAFAGLVYVIPANLIPHPLSSSSTGKSIDTTLFVVESEPEDTVYAPAETDTLALPWEKTTNDTLVARDTVILPHIPYLTLTEYSFKHIKDFFRKASEAKGAGKTLRVLHMGDSQIEGDRITRYIRESLQERYGGTGPGLFTVYDPQKLNPSIWLDNYGDWTLDKIFYKHRLLKDRQYGIMGTVAEFKPGTDPGFRFRPSPWAEEKANKYYKVRLFLGEIKDTLCLKGYIGKTEVISDTLEESDGLTEINWEFEDNVPKMKLMLNSASSPPFLGCALDSLAGIAVDNLALRGQSVPWLHRTNRNLYKTMISYLDVGLIIFQFGTNMIPTRTHDFRFYRIKIERQLRILKKLAPDCPVLVIGTADAAYLDNGIARSYDHIGALNKAQRAAAMNCGAAFFDLYSAMGGEGAMIDWVNTKPPLAISDYIHFTHEGGKKVAAMIMESLYAVADSSENDIE